MSDQKHDWLVEIIRREGAVLFADHPSPEQLVAYCEAKNELSPAEQHQVSDHLRVCAECASDRDRLSQARQELRERGPRREVSDSSHASGWSSGLGRRLREWVAPTRLLPVAVVVAITVAVIGPRPEPPRVHPVGPVVVLRGDVERGAVPTVAPTAEGTLTLSFVLPGTGAGAVERCAVTIVAASGTVVAQVAEVSAHDDYGTFLLTLDAEGLADGNYTLTARDHLGSRDFSFDLQRPAR